ncbi:MAG: C25 family cysteine peptidase [Candidatus Cloacimonadota bacterium]
MYRSLKLLLLVALSLLIVSGLSAQVRKHSLSAGSNQARITSQSQSGLELQFSVSGINLEEIQTRGGVFDRLSVEGYGQSQRIGEPQLPTLSKIIAVPVGAELSFEVLGRQNRRMDSSENRLQHRLVPAQESVSKSADPASLTFSIKEEAYSVNELRGGELFRLEEIGFMRGVRLFQFYYEPVQYNPVSGELEICLDASIRVNFTGSDQAATDELLARTASYEYEALYAKTIFNWDASTRASLVRYPTKMLILCPPNYTDEMAPFVTWKKQQGYNVIVTTVGTGGTVANTTTAIKTYMQNLWAAATAQDPAPTYLLIVGDTSTSGDNIIASDAQVSSPSSDHITDNYYVRLNGTDYVPEMYYGRFSVSSATELTSIVNKTVTFEKTQMPDLTYLGKAVMIAGQDPTYGPTHGDGAINYGTSNYFNSSQGITSNTYLYAISGTSDAAVIANANEGRGYMNYTAHGGQTSWSDPTFTVSNVNSMTNTNKYGVMVGNCCLTNAFDTSVCFGESIIRKANAGGVIYIGGTNSTYWNEDYWWAVGAKGTANGNAPAYDATRLGAYDAMFHTHSEAVADWATTTGDVIYMGNLAVAQGGSSYLNYYWEIYSIMGDPSLMPYFGVPTVNTATFPTTILLGASSITVTATPYSRVALSMGGTLYGTGIVPANGSLTLAFTPFTTTGSALLVITAQDKITRIENITIAPNSGPYLNVAGVVYSDTNNNSPEYNETGKFTPTFHNVGSSAASNVTATLTCSTSGIVITDGTQSIASLASGATSAITDAFSFTIPNGIAHGTMAAFTITMVSGTNTWVHNFSLEINAPALVLGTITIGDASGNNNGMLDPGETVTITIPLNNAGGAQSSTGSGTLTCNTSGITVNTGTANFAAVIAGGSRNLSFSITASSSMAVGTVVNLNFNATAGSYTASKVESLTAGIILEDFESGNFNSFPWTMGGSLPWTIANTGAQSGTYTAKSGAITHSQSTTMETTRVLSSPGDLSFWYKVSSESGYDFLKFYIDNTYQNQWSGSVDWTQVTYTLAAGTHVLKWEYMKDSSVDGGSNCAWIDNIIFPASTAPSAFNPPQNLSAMPGNNSITLSWQAPASGTPTGYKIFKNSSLLTTVTALTYTDNAVVNGTSYSYYLKAVYSGGESESTATVTVTPTAVVNEFIIGTGNTPSGYRTASPVNVYYQSLHGQSVYTAAELNAVGIIGPIEITQIGFNISELPTLAMPNFLVRMGHNIQLKCY